MGAILDRARSSPLLRTRALRQLTLANGLVGLSASIALPFTPLFLARRVGATATEIGLLLTLSGIAGVVVSSLVGPLSDRLPSRKPLIAAGCLSAAACDAIYALSSSYPVVLAASVTLLAGAWVGVPQLYARGRELLEAAGAAPALSLSALRSAVSLAWIVGPPLAGVLLTVSGFPQAFLLASASLVAAAVLAVADGERDVRRSTEPPRPSGKASSSFPRWGAAAAALALSVGAVVLLQTANTLGVTTMPLLLTTTMHGTPSQVGAVFGLSAGLEIPIML